MRRIAFFLPTLSGGGAERAAILLARAWPDDPKPLLVVRSLSGPYLPLTRGMDVEDLHTRAHGIITTLVSGFRLASVCRRHSIDTVVVYLSPVSAIIAQILLGKGLRVYISVQTVPRPPNESPARLTKSARFRIWVAERLTARVDGYFVPAALSAEFIKRGKRCPSIHHVPNPAEVSSCSLVGESRADLVWVGRLVHQKRPDLVIALMEKLPHLTLDMYGSGELHSEISDLIIDRGLSNRIRLMGFKNDLKDVYPGHKALVVTSDYEGFCNVIVEALAHGLVVVSTDAPHGPVEILENCDAGRIVQRGDVVALASALEDILHASQLDPCRHRSLAIERSLNYTPTRLARVMALALKRDTEASQSS